MERLHGAIRGLREAQGPGEPDRTAQEEPGAAPSAGLRLPTGPGLPWWDPAQDAKTAPGQGTVTVRGRVLGAGSRVVLRPGLRRSDAQDIFLAGSRATVEAVLQDFDGETHLAVTVDGDPGTDVRRAQGRFLYFRPDEVDPADIPADIPAGDRAEGGT
jgi:hypothetical protein